LKSRVTVTAALILATVAWGPAARAGDAKPFREIDERSHRAIERGLQYLDRIQGRDGAWGGGATYPTAMTALAGLAMLGAGHTPGRGRYGKDVERAVNYLLRNQDRTGLISTQAEGGRAMHGHGFATTFLAQACGMDAEPERTARVRKAVQKAVILIARTQSPQGGWYYQPQSGMDEGSVTVTEVQGLRAARNIGVTVPPKTIAKAVEYMKKSQNSDGSIRYSLRMGGSQGRPALTAAGCEVFFSLGMYDAPETKKAMNKLRSDMKSGRNTGHKAYFDFYAGQAIFQAGGDDWKKFYPPMRERILKEQQASGSWRGSISEVYCTAIYLMLLELPYRYLPVFQR